MEYTQKIKKDVFRLFHDDFKQPVTYLLISDIHIDSKHCNLKKLKNDLEEAKSRNAKVMIFGDLFDAMQGRNDKRRFMMDLKKNDLERSYFNGILETAYNILKDYDVIFISRGNHETSVQKYNDIDLIELLQDKIPFAVGSYRGFISFSFKNKAGKSRIILYYNHGSGGLAPMTMGVLEHKRTSIWVDADIIISGHNHQNWSYESMRVSISSAGNLFFKKQTHLKMSTYKQEFFGDGFAAERNWQPSVLGGYWLTFVPERTTEYGAKSIVRWKIERTD